MRVVMLVTNLPMFIKGILPNSFYLRREASFTERFFGPRGRQAAMPGLQLGTVQSVHRTVHTEIAGRAQCTIAVQCAQSAGGHSLHSYQGTC